MQTDRLDDRRRKHIAQPAAGDMLVAIVAAETRLAIGAFGQQVTEIVKQRRRDQAVGHALALGEAGGLQRMGLLTHAFVAVLAVVRGLQQVENLIDC